MGEVQENRLTLVVQGLLTKGLLVVLVGHLREMVVAVAVQEALVLLVLDLHLVKEVQALLHQLQDLL